MASCSFERTTASLRLALTIHAVVHCKSQMISWSAALNNAYLCSGDMAQSNMLGDGFGYYTLHMLLQSVDGDRRHCLTLIKHGLTDNK